MNFKSIFFYMLLLSSFAYSKGQYFISKNDFLKSFSDTIVPAQLIITSETGEKYFVGFYSNAQLKLEMTDDSRKTILLGTIKLNKGVMNATEITKFWQNKKQCTVPFDDIKAISIRKMFTTYATPYYDLDSLQLLYRLKSDSLEYSSTKMDRLMIELIPKYESTIDTIILLENACYHMEIKNGIEIQYGVIQNITSDSIYITTVFASGVPKNVENSESNHAILLQDITKIKMLKSGGHGFKTLLLNDYEILLKQAPKELSYSPCWFSISRVNGELYFYRLMLTEKGFKGIRHNNGRYYWWER
jgi:hypothetical protein